MKREEDRDERHFVGNGYHNEIVRWKKEEEEKVVVVMAEMIQ